jgi:hypothetical protein
VSEASARRLLWLALLLMLPLPLLGIDRGLVPAGRSLMLGAICALVILLESANGVAGLLVAVFWGQALVYSLLLWCVAWGIVRLTRGLSSRGRGALVLGGILAIALLCSSIEIYRTPYRAASIHSSLLGVYQ